MYNIILCTSLLRYQIANMKYRVSIYSQERKE